MSGLRQLRVVSREGHQAAVIAPTDKRGANTEWVVHREGLVACLAGLEDPIDTVVFVDDDRIDDATLQQIEEMVGLLASDDARAMVSPVSDAIKVVHENVIVRGLERSKLFVALPPAIVRRTTLERALALSNDDWINPISVVALSGGLVSSHQRKKQ